MAGTAKRFQVFRMPAASATIDMKPMYGNITLVIQTASSKACRPEPMAHTSTGAAATPRMQVAISAQASRVATASIKAPAAASPSFARVAGHQRHEGLREGTFGK